MSDLVQRARTYAVNAHARIDHRRKYSGQPYDAHLRAVADIVASVTNDPLCIAAAWLHDTVEDTPATFADLEAVFGAELARLVWELTDVSKPSDGNRARRKAMDREHLAAASPRAKTVKLADIIDNTRDITRHDPRFARTYLFEARDLLAVLREGDAGLLRRAERELERSARRLGLGTALEPLPTDEEPLPGGPFADHQQRALRLFVRAFTARDIAESLRSFDGDADPGKVRAVLERHDLPVAGLRETGRVSAYTRCADLLDDADSLPRRAFLKDQIVSADAFLSEVILVLTRHEHCFVTLLDDVDAVITRVDIQKPVVRMWLFGMITMIEMNLTEQIRTRWPDGSWCQLLSKNRLQKAETLFEERRRLKRATDLLDCLQIGDKLDLLTRDETQLQRYGFGSRAAARKVAREFEALRNNLAHAQDIVTHDWPQIVRMTQRIEWLIAR